MDWGTQLRAKRQLYDCDAKERSVHWTRESSAVLPRERASAVGKERRSSEAPGPFRMDSDLCKSNLHTPIKNSQLVAAVVENV